jgi:hypothetical protein
MDRLSGTKLEGAGAVALALVCSGCPSAAKDGPPPAESVVIASAAPRALGALAAGTDAAPRALASPGGSLRAEPDEAAPDPDDDDPDAGAASPDAGSSAEDLPL